MRRLQRCLVTFRLVPSANSKVLAASNEKACGAEIQKETTSRDEENVLKLFNWPNEKIFHRRNYFHQLRRKSFRFLSWSFRPSGARNDWNSISRKFPLSGSVPLIQLILYQLMSFFDAIESMVDIRGLELDFERISKWVDRMRHLWAKSQSNSKFRSRLTSTNFFWSVCDDSFDNVSTD